MSKVKKSFYISPQSLEKLTELKEEHTLDSYGSALEFLLDNYANSSDNHSLIQSQIIAQLVTDQIKEILDIMRRRSVFVDDSLKILLHIINDVIIQHNLDLREGEDMFDYLNKPSRIYTEAKEKVSKEKKYYKEQAMLRHQNKGDNQ